MGASKHTVGASKYIGPSKQMECPNMEGDIQTCRGFPNIQGASKHKRGIQNVGGVQTYGGIKTYSRCIQTYGASKCMGTYGHPLVWQSMLSLCCVCTGHPNISKHTEGHPKHMLGVSKHMLGVSKHTGGIPACLPIPRSGFCH